MGSVLRHWGEAVARVQWQPNVVVTPDHTAGRRLAEIAAMYWGCPSWSVTTCAMIWILLP